MSQAFNAGKVQWIVMNSRTVTNSRPSSLYFTLMYIAPDVTKEDQDCTDLHLSAMKLPSKKAARALGL